MPSLKPKGQTDHSSTGGNADAHRRPSAGFARSSWSVHKSPSPASGRKDQEMHWTHVELRQHGFNSGQVIQHAHDLEEGSGIIRWTIKGSIRRALPAGLRSERQHKLSHGTN